MSMDTYATSTWREPPLRAPTASFEDFGIPRGGVLANMQPLGTKPSVKLRLKIAGTSSKVKNGLSDEARDTPDSTPAAERARSESRPPEEPTLNITPPKEEEDDYDYAPKGGKANSSRQSKSSKKNESQPPPPSSPPRRLSQGTTSSRKLPHSIGAIVKAAVDKAESQGNKILAGALEKVYHDSENDLEFTGVLEAILSQRPTESQIVEFQRRIKEAKKHVKSGDNQSGPNSLQSTPTSMPRRLKLRRESEHNKQTQNKDLVLPSPHLDGPLSQPLILSPQGPHQSLSQLSRSMSPEAASQSPQPTGTALSSPVRRLRSGSASSISSLSSVNEDVLNPEPRSSSSGMGGKRRSSRSGAKANGKSKQSSHSKKQGKDLSTKPTASKRTAADAALDEEDATTKRTRLMQEAAERAKEFPVPEESFVREPLLQPIVESHLHKTPPGSRSGSQSPIVAAITRSGRFRLPPPDPPINLNSGGSSPLSDDLDVEDLELPHPPRPLRSQNRAASPLDIDIDRPTKRVRTSARTKTS